MLSALPSRLLVRLARRNCRPACFDATWYRATYRDVARSGMDPLRHYLRHGRDEGRMPCFMTAAWRERDLLWGLLEDGVGALSALAHDPLSGPADRIWATLACARAAVRQGDWTAAADWLSRLDPERDLVEAFCLPDPILLAIEVAVVTGDTDRAASLVALGLKRFGPLPDLRLAEANHVARANGFGPGWDAAMARLYRPAGVTGVTVRPDPGDLPAFDRLAAARAPAATGRGGPLVSVIMPARDAAATIGTALDSLSAQSWRALEILVIDNGSSDGTADIVRAKAQADPRIRLLDGSAEPGTYAARNLGMARANGAFLTVLDADDWAHPQRIARQVRTLRRAPGRVVATQTDWVRTTSDLRFTRWWREEGLTHPDISSLMIRAHLRDSLGFWDPVRAGADSEYCDRIIAVHGPGAIRRTCPGVPLGFGRLRDGSLTGAGETAIGSHVFGSRAQYFLAGRRWHDRMQADGDLPLPRTPARRPFPAPAVLTVTSPDAPPGRMSDADVVAGSDLYDDHWYLRAYPDLRVRELDGALHYDRTGEAEGRNPGPDFAASAYRMAYGPIDGSALRHYLSEGRARGLSPLPVFDGARPAPPEGRHALIFGHQAGAQVFGAERYLVDLLDRAAEEGWTPSVVLPQILSRDYLEALKARSYRVHVVPYGWYFGGVAPHPATLDRLSRLLRDTGADEVHQNSAVLDAPLRAARANGVPSVVHVHELPAEDPQICRDLGVSAREWRAHLIDIGDRFAAVSPAVAKWLDLPAERVIPVANRIDSALRTLPFAPETPIRVGLVGNLVAKKGLEDTLEVARLCDREALPVRFVLVGPDGSPDLPAPGTLPPNVTHTGYAASPADAMARTDIVLSLSQVAESFGRTVMEALVAGRPVICYDRGTPPELVGRDGAAGRVVPAGDPAAVVRALSNLLGAPGGLARASAAARARGASLLDEAGRADGARIFGRAAQRP